MHQANEYRLAAHHNDDCSKEAYYLTKMAFQAILGIHRYEREHAQRILVSLRICFFDRAIIRQYMDDLIHKLITEYCQLQKPLLLERMAHDLSMMLWHQTPGKEELMLILQKPEALARAQGPYVKIVLKGA